MIDRTNHLYRVVRYYPHPGHGIIEEVLGRGLSIEDAELLADRETPVVSGEHLMIEDQDEAGLDAIIRIDRLGRQRE